MIRFKKFSHLTCIFFLLLIVFSCKNDDSAPGPVITGFSPAVGLVGTTVNIAGNNFSPTASENIVKFNGTQATVTVAAITLLTVTVPEGATTGKVTVQVKKSVATSANDFTITTNPYDIFRVKEVQSGDAWVNVYDYNINDVLTSVENYNADKSQLVSKTTFSYNEDGTLATSVVIYPGNFVANKNDYTYSSGQLAQRIFSQAPVSAEGVVGSYTVTTIKEYTFQNNRISAITMKDGSENVIDEATYTYSTVNADPQILIHHTSPSIFDVTTLYFADVTDPDSTPDPENSSHLLVKNYTLSSNHKFDYSNTYTSDGQGKLHDYTSTYPNSTSWSGTLTYTYEEK